MAKWRKVIRLGFGVGFLIKTRLIHAKLKRLSDMPIGTAVMWSFILKSSKHFVLKNFYQRLELDNSMKNSNLASYSRFIGKAELYEIRAEVEKLSGKHILQVMDSVNGFLCSPQDLNCFSDRIIKLLKDEKLRASMGKAGKEHVKKNFLITRLMLDWPHLMNRLLSDRGK